MNNLCETSDWPELPIEWYWELNLQNNNEYKH